MSFNPEIIGLLAACLTTGGYVPQALKVIRTRHTRDLSLPMYCIMTTGGLTWLTYGLMIESLPIILANAFTSTLTGTILILKLRFG